MSFEEQQSQDLLADVPEKHSTHIANMEFSRKSKFEPLLTKRARLNSPPPFQQPSEAIKRRQKRKVAYMMEEDTDSAEEVEEVEEEELEIKKKPLKKRVLFDEGGEGFVGIKNNKTERKALLEPKEYPLDSRDLYSLKVETMTWDGPFSAVVISRKRDGKEAFDYHLRRANVKKIRDILSDMMESFKSPSYMTAETQKLAKSITMYEIGAMDYNVDDQLFIRTEVFKQARFSPLLVFEKRVPGKPLFPYKMPVEYIVPLYNALDDLLISQNV